MTGVYTVSGMRAADRAAIDSGGVSEKGLILRAATGVCEELKKRIPVPGRILVACGTGNNGADGYCLCAMLRRCGYLPEILSVEGKLSEGALCYRTECKELSLRFVELADAEDEYAAVVDALLGTGLTRAPEGEYLEAIRLVNRLHGLKVAVDIPSGLNADTGLVFGEAVKSDVTVTFHGYKFGQLLNDGRDFCGELVVKDIGLSDSVLPEAVVCGKETAKNCFPKRKHNTHKGSYGRAAVIAGSRSYFGAGVLSESALTALNSGVGYCYLGCPKSLADLYRLKNPEVLVRELAEKDGVIAYDPEGLDGLLEKADAVAVGMGLDTGEGVYRSVCRILERTGLSVVLDADALNALAAFGTEPVKATGCRVLITPHIKEFERLSGYTDLKENALVRTKEFAKAFGCTVLLKGVSTIITDGDRVAVNVAGSPALAKGGSGDVLSGILAALLARGIPPFEAGVAGSYLLGRAGELAAERYSEYSPVASDIVSLFGGVIMEFAAN